MEEDISIGYWIKRRRKVLGFTQKELANLVGCATITIAKIEAEQRRPSREFAQQLARHLQIPAGQTHLFVSILRGEKSSSQLHRLLNPEPLPGAENPFSLGTDQLRGAALIQHMARSTLVGRSSELAAARREWDLARSGESRVLILHGEPGIGKSRLAVELIRAARQEHAAVMVGECFTGGERPYAPFSRIIQNINHFPHDFPSVAIADLKFIAPQLETRFPSIAPNPHLEPLAEQMRVFESVYLFFGLLARENPLLVLVEDIHWADHGSLELISTLARRFRQVGTRALVVLTAREELPQQSGDLPAFFDNLLRAHLSTSIHLDRFDLDETHTLLADRFGQQITGDLVDLIQRETQGNPFFINEVCKELMESGSIYWAQGRWQRKEITEIQVPKSVQNAILARLNKLPEEVQDILLMAAILGRRFDFDLLLSTLACG
jgi:predicted ATPase/DNA-binding XRE family transcriptional regulator